MALLDPKDRAGFKARVRAFQRTQTEGDEFYDPDQGWPAHWGGKFPGDHPSHHRDIVAALLGPQFLTERGL